VTSTVQAAQAANTGVPVGRPAHAQVEKGLGTATEWLSYGGDKASSKYSPLAQIGGDNFNRLKVAWTWRSAEEAITKANPKLKTWVWESTPLMVGGILYVSTSLSQVAAIDAATGKPRWVYDPETWKNGSPSNNGFVHRGVAYWADGDNQCILFGTGDGYLIALNAQTGKPISTFGRQGRIDLTQGLGRAVDRRLYGVSSPPIICRDVVVMGSKVHDVPLAKEMPPGDVRGFDVRPGKQQWQFRSIPGEGEFGNETWEQGSWKTTGGANVWTLMSADEELGYVYLPFSTPSNDNYGGRRPGDGLFGESLVALDECVLEYPRTVYTDLNGLLCKVIKRITLYSQPLKVIIARHVTLGSGPRDQAPLSLSTGAERHARDNGDDHSDDFSLGPDCGYHRRWGTRI
jgi:quinoprotein glucose dehydrogenase